MYPFLQKFSATNLLFFILYVHFPFSVCHKHHLYCIPRDLCNWKHQLILRIMFPQILLLTTSFYCIIFIVCENVPSSLLLHPKVKCSYPYSHNFVYSFLPTYFFIRTSLPDEVLLQELRVIKKHLQFQYIFAFWILYWKYYSVCLKNASLLIKPLVVPERNRQRTCGRTVISFQNNHSAI